MHSSISVTRWDFLYGGSFDSSLDGYNFRLIGGGRLAKRLVVGAAVAAALIGAPTAVAESIGFTSPSGNIG